MPIKQFLIILTVLLLFLGISAFTQHIEFDNLSETQLLQKDYYFYVISPYYQEKMEWKRRISIRSFEWHCIRDMDSRDDRWNYIGIYYKDGNNKDILNIRISPNDALFDEENAQPININPPLNESYSIEYYVNDKMNIIRLVDSQEIEVVISSSLSFEITKEAISSLVLIGNFTEQNAFYKDCR